MTWFDTPKQRYSWLAVIWFGLPILMTTVSFFSINNGEGSFLFWLIILMTPSISLRFGIVYGLIALTVSVLIVRHGMRHTDM